jgi:glycosyltransferase involved in cell wall biosynthesis
MNNDSLPLVSLCIPTYNAERTVRDTLESILSQTYPNLIVHVSDNASSDNTINILESMTDRRIIVHRHNENVGGEGNFNRCIEYCEGKYTAIFHADDLYEPEMVARQVAFLEKNPEAGAVFTEAVMIDEASKKIGEIRLPNGIAPKNCLYDFETVFKAILRHSNFFICPSAMVRTDVYRKDIQSWRGDIFKTSADLDVWLRILTRYRIGYLQERLMRYRIWDNQGSAHLRLKTDRADFFLVIDHYLAKESVRSLLDEDDLSNYRWLDRTNRVKRAVNLFLTDQPRQARDLLKDIGSMDTMITLFKARKGIIVLLVGFYVVLMDALGLKKPGKIPLRYVIRILKR